MTATKNPKFFRILLKLSGEALGGESGVGICPKFVQNMAEQIREVQELDVQVVVVVGGGNIFRGLSGSEHGIERATGDYMGMLATVDGIYDSDPKKNPRAKRFAQISYLDALQKRLKVMDSTAFSLCMDNKMPIIVFDLFKAHNLRRVVMGEKVGTLVTG
jgi:uridylate kinase